MLPLLTLFSIFPVSLASLDPAQPPSPGKLIILDIGVGHRSTPVTRWRTSLRSVSTRGDNATILQQYGPAPSAGNTVVEPIGAYDMARSPSISSLYIATGEGIFRTNLDGSARQSIIPDVTNARSLAVAEKSHTLYYGTGSDGCIWRANIDGTGVGLFRNVSQGTNWGYANSYPDGMLVDEKEGWLYWSASRGPDYGSIRRVRLTGGDEQVLVKGLNMPRQLRIQGDMLYWAEMGRWSTSPTSLSRAKLPSSPTVSSLLQPEIVIHSNQSSIFYERDYTGDLQTLSIKSFAFHPSGNALWFVMQSSGRTMFAKLVEVELAKKEWKLLNKDPKDLGIPMGLEFVR
ncbi:hypothetical protein GQ44DRAFT_738496 [Phaeosphaeriaceae sp. PMI808]|nr:hypothetical protein GQ44DRAFT_738496 [Phaeosphaeriaceae sp. PMI808]